MESFSFDPGLSSSIAVKTHSGRTNESYSPGTTGTCTDGGINSNEYTHMYVMYKKIITVYENNVHPVVKLPSMYPDKSQI